MEWSTRAPDHAHDNVRTQSYENVKAPFKGIDNQPSVGLEKNIELSRKIALAGQMNSPKVARASDRISLPPGLMSDEHVRFMALKGERDELKRQKGIVSAGEHWTQPSPEIKKALHDAPAAGSWLAMLRHTTRPGLMHMGQPSGFIPQVVQLAASVVQLWFIPGRAFLFRVQLEFEQGVPRYPFINSGALVVTDILCSH